MNDFYMFRIGSGLYDVLLDGTKQRFGQPDTKKNRPRYSSAQAFRDRLNPLSRGRCSKAAQRAQVHSAEPQLHYLHTTATADRTYQKLVRPAAAL